MDKNILSSLFRKSHQIEATKMFINCKMGKLTVMEQCNACCTAVTEIDLLLQETPKVSEGMMCNNNPDTKAHSA